jgi:hypothetical protein
MPAVSRLGGPTNNDGPRPVAPAPLAEVEPEPVVVEEDPFHSAEPTDPEE